MIQASLTRFPLAFSQRLLFIFFMLSILFGAQGVAYAGTPAFSSSFSPTTIAPGSISTLTYVIDNSANDTPVTNVTFTNTLPASVTLNSPINMSDSCSGVVVASAGGSSVSYTLDRFPIGVTCEISVDVTSSTPGTHTNTTGDLTSSGGNSGSTAASLVVDSSRPNLVIAVAPSAMSPGAVATLTYTFDNTLNGSEMSALHIDAVLPSGVVVSSQPNATTTCTIIDSNGYSGVVVTPGASNVKLGYFTVAAGASCTASVDITSSVISSYTLNSGVLFNATVQSFGSFTFVNSPVSLGVQNTAQLSVESSLLSISAPNSMVPGLPTTLSFTLLNNNRDQNITNLSFTDDLNAALSGLSATNLPATGFCGAGSSISGTSLLSISNVSLASGESCSFDVSVLVPSNASAGSYTNTSSTIVYDLDGSSTTSVAASNAINVYSAPSLSMQVVNDPVGLGDDVTLRYTITNTDLANALSAATFQHTLNALVAGVTINTLPAANSCGTGSIFTGNTDGSGNLIFGMSNGALVAGGSCSIDVVLTIPEGGALGDFILTTDNITGVVDGETLVGTAASDTLSVIGAPALSLALSSDTVLPGDSVTATFTLNYSANAQSNATELGFSVDLEAALTGLVSTSATQSDVCGSGSSISGTSMLTFAGGELAAGNTCSFSVNLQIPNSAAGSAVSLATSTVSGTVSSVAVLNAAVTRSLLISGITATKTFISNPVLPGSTTVLRYSLSNASNAGAATSILFTDSLTSVISTMSATSLPSTPCGAGSSMSGTTNLLFSGGELQPGASCSFDVPISIPAGAVAGIYNSVSSAVSASVNSTNVSAGTINTTLTVEELTVNLSTTASNPTSLNPIPISINFSRDVVNFDASDLVVVNGSVTNFSGSGEAYLAEITPAGDGGVTVDLPINTVDDAVDGAVQNPAATQLAVTYESTPTIADPSISISGPSASTTASGPIAYTVNYSDVTQVLLTTSAVTLNKTGSADATVVITDGDTSSATVSLTNITGDGTLGISIGSNTARNSTKLAGGAGPSSTVAVDNTQPSLAITSNLSGNTFNNSSFIATFTFSEDVSDFTIGDITAVNANISNFSSVSSAVYTATVTPIAEGSVTLDVLAGVASDNANNVNVGATEFQATYDVTKPTVSISSTIAGAATNGAFTVTFTFSEDVAGFTLSDVSAGNASVSNFSASSASVYTVTITPTSNGAVTVDVPADIAQDSASNDSVAATQFITTYDTSVPTVTITSNVTGDANSAFTATFTFNENVTGFTLADISSSNAIVTNFSANSASVYSATVSPVSDGVVAINVAGNVAQDVAGNNNVAATQFTATYDTNSPTVVISSDIINSATNNAFSTTFTFSEGVVGFALADIITTNANISNFASVSTSVYTATVTPISDGVVSIDVAGDVAQDAAGNNNTAASQFITSYDATAPSVIISSSLTNSTINNAFTVTFTFSENVTGFAIGDISAVNAMLSDLVSSSASVYTATVTPTSDGVVTVDVAANVVQDTAGNNNTAATPLTATYDATPPTVSISANVSGSVTNSPFTATFTFSEDVTGFTASDVSVTNATVSAVSEINPSVYTATITPVGDGTVTLGVAANVAQDAAGNNNTAASQLTTTYDATPPTLVITSSLTGNVTNSPFTVTFTFSEDVSGFAVSDVNATNATVGALSSSSASVYTATITPTSDGSITIGVGANAVQDAAGNGNAMALSFSTTYDATSPEVVITTDALGSAINGTFTATFTFSEAVTGFAANDVIVTNATIGALSASSALVYTTTVTPTSDGAVTVNVAANAAQDGAGNANTAASQFSIVYDASAPILVITSDITGAITNSAFTATFTFSEDVTGFANADVTVTNATLGAISASSASVYTVTVTPISDGLVTIDVAGNAAQDVAGNNNAAATQYTTTYDVSLPSIVISSDISGTATNRMFIATFTFSEDINGFVSSDVTVSNATIGSLSATSASVYTATITPINDGAITIDVAPNVVQDAASNGNTAATTLTTVYDTISPQLLSTSPASDDVDVGIAQLSVNLVFGEDVQVNGGNIELVKLADNSVVETLALLGDSVTRESRSITAQFARNLEQNEVYSIVIRSGDISDEAGNGWQGLTGTALTFTAANEPPGSNDDSATVDEDGEVIIAVLANDEDLSDGVDVSSVSVVMQPLHGAVAVSSITGDITYTPNENYNGEDSFTYEVSDTQGSVSAPAMVSIAINPVNDLPVAANDNVVTSEEQSVVIAILDNDTDADETSNLLPNEINPASVVIIDNVSSGALVIVDQAAVNEDSSLQVGQIVYVPDSNFFGIETFTYTVEDTFGALSAAATVTINVGAVNDNPVASDDTVNASEDEAVVFNVINNDVDPENELNVQSVRIELQGSLGVAEVNSNTGSITYTPNTNRFGTDSFQYTVQDQQGLLSNIATVTVNIASVNDMPVAVNDTYLINTRTPTIISVLENDNDPDSVYEPSNIIDVATVNVVSAPSLGTVAVNRASGALTYTPSDDVTEATDTFSYQVTDTVGAFSNTATVEVRLKLRSISLIANDDSAVTIEDTPLTLNILANDGDDTRTLDVTSVNISQPVSNGVTQINGDGSVTYSPNANFFGEDSFSYTVKDDSGDISNVANVVIMVASVNDAPAISGMPPVSVIAGNLYQFMPTATDVDNSGLTFSIQNQPSWSAFNTSNGLLSGTPADPDAGSYNNIIISVADNAGGSASLPAFSIDVVTTASLTPIVSNINIAVKEDESVTFSVLALDPNNLPLTYQLVQVPESGSLSGELPLLTYTPNENFFGDDSFSYIASNGEYTSEPASIGISVEAVNDAPEAVDDQVTVIEGQEVIIDVLANDTDVENEALTVTSASTNQGRVTVVENQVSYLAEDNASGTVIIDYTIIDDGGLSSSAQVVVTVNENQNNEKNINLNVPDDINVNATGLVTRVSLGQAVATDNEGNAVPITLNTPPFFRPGKHSVVWQAKAQGDIQQGSQLVSVNPIIDIEKSQRVQEGRNATINVFLNGTSPEYPVNIPYSISGTSDNNDHSLTDGVLVLESGTRASLSVDIANDGLDEGDETLIVSILPTLNVGNAVHTLTIVENSVTPELQLIATQRDTSITTMYSQAGIVEVALTLENKTSNDIAFIDWSDSTGELNQLNISSIDTLFSFSPESLSEGVYQVRANVTDTDGLVGVAEITLLLSTSPPVLTNADTDGDGIPDSQEGLGDKDGDGIADYLDAIDACNIQPANRDDASRYLIEGEPGSCFRLGNVATATSGAIVVDESELPLDVDATNLGTIIDFVVSGLDEIGQNYRVVIPQRSVIPAGASYRKYNAAQSRWKDFEVVGADAIHSAAGEQGICPPPGDLAYVEGLTEGHWCIQLTISDGGPNDDDGFANGSIVDPSGLAVAANGNQGPIANDDEITFASSRLNILDVLTNDTDPDNDVITLVSANAYLGSVEITNNQLFYVQPESFSGTDTLVYAISDGNGGSAFAVATLNVDVNNAPRAQDDTVQTDNQTAISIDVLANDTDADGDTLTLVYAAADIGNVEVVDDKLYYIPSQNFTGIATISYGIEDSIGAVSSAFVTVTVTARGNQAPIAQNDIANTSGEASITFDVLANDSDADGDALTLVSVVTTTGNASIQNNKIVYVPPSGFTGTVTVTYIVTDGLLETSATLTINISKKVSASGGSFSLLLTLLLLMTLYYRLYGSAASTHGRNVSCKS